MPPTRPTRDRVAAVRRFNRFYTRQIGVLRKNYLDSPYSLGEMRVLYELSHGEVKTATDIGRALDLDAGYLSRVLRNFQKRGLISRKTSAADARQSDLALTARGAKIFAPLERRSQDLVGGMLGGLKADEQARLVAAMTTIETLLGELPGDGVAKPSYVLRQPRHGDFGWIVSRHAELYALEYGWVEPFEGLCAQIVADFINKFDAKRERCWIAELNGENVGCIMLAKDFGRSRPHPAAAGRSESARARRRRAAGRGMRAFCTPGRLQESHAVDAQHPFRRAPHL